MHGCPISIVLNALSAFFFEGPAVILYEKPQQRDILRNGQCCKIGTAFRETQRLGSARPFTQTLDCIASKRHYTMTILQHPVALLRLLNGKAYADRSMNAHSQDCNIQSTAVYGCGECEARATQPACTYYLTLLDSINNCMGGKPTSGAHSDPCIPLRGPARGDRLQL